MDVVNYSNHKMMEMLGGAQRRTKGKKYRLNRYCLIHEKDEGTMIYNGLTSSIVFLRPYELINIYTEDPCDYAEFLVENYFLVPEDFDEKYVVDTYRERQRPIITPNYLDHPNHFTILTTTTCNARCFYCYELKAKGKTPMSLETAEKVAKYIITNADKTKELHLDWFGGEPLFNKEVINIIVSRVASAGFKYSSSMISNGYLFDKETAKIAKDFWNLNSVQITLDGTEEVYNKTKNYIYKDCDSPFKVVIENIKGILDVGISVSIRMNIDKHNFDDASNLIDYLDAEFKEANGLSMYVWPIFEEGFERTEEERKELYDNLYKLQLKIFESGKNISHGLPNEVKAIHCLVDGGNGVTISPKGDLGLCEHYINSKFIGHIDNPNDKNWEEIKSWRKYQPALEICEDCPLYPICLREPGCPDETVCSPSQKEYELNHYKLSLEERYKEFINRPVQQERCDNNCCGKHMVSKYERVITRQDGTVEHIPVENNGNN